MKIGPVKVVIKQKSLEKYLSKEVVSIVGKFAKTIKSDLLKKMMELIRSLLRQEPLKS